MRTPIMKNIFLIPLIIIFSGCTAPITATSSNYNKADFSKLKTYSWGTNRITIDEKGKSVNEFSEQVEEMARRDIQPITDSVLSKKGFERITSGNSDFIVLYVATGRTQNNLPRPNIGPGGVNYKVNEIGTYLVGSITIYIYDGKSKTVLWQGIGQTPVTGKGTNNSRLKETIEKIFRDFPPKN